MSDKRIETVDIDGTAVTVEINGPFHDARDKRPHLHLRASIGDIYRELKITTAEQPGHSFALFDREMKRQIERIAREVAGHAHSISLAQRFLKNEPPT